MSLLVKYFIRTNGQHHTIWSIREKDLPVSKRILLRLYKILFISFTSPFNKHIINHASALTFTFLLSLIPMLAMIFSIAKGFGIQEKIEPLLLEKTLGGEIAGDLIPKIIEYVNNTKVTALGSIGLLFIIFTSVSLLSQIEGSFNMIWAVKKSRSMIRKASDYLSILILSPLLLAVTVGLSTTLKSHAVLQKLLATGLFAGAMKLFFLSIPWVSSVIAITLVYLIIPNTSVRLGPALAAGTFAGVLWQLSQTLFITFQIGVARYNAIYGTFATVPIFMIWLQVTWIIVLFGGVLNYACQNAGRFHPLEFAKNIPFAGKEKICLALFLAICRKFERGKGPSNPEDLSDQLGLSENFVRSGIKRLLDIGAVLPVSSEIEELYVPAGPPDELKIAEFFQEVKGIQEYPLEFRDMEINHAVGVILDQRRKALDAQFNGRGITAGIQVEQNKSESQEPE